MPKSVHTARCDWIVNAVTQALKQRRLRDMPREAHSCVKAERHYTLFMAPHVVADMLDQR